MLASGNIVPQHVKLRVTFESSHTQAVSLLLFVPDMLSPSADPEVPMDYSSEYDASDKSSIDDSDEACSIPGSFSPDNNQDGASGDQR